MRVGVRACGCVAAWVCGRMGVWACGSAGVRASEPVGVWPRECACVRGRAVYFLRGIVKPPRVISCSNPSKATFCSNPCQTFPPNCSHLRRSRAIFFPEKSVRIGIYACAHFFSQCAHTSSPDPHTLRRTVRRRTCLCMRAPDVATTFWKAASRELSKLTRLSGELPDSCLR